MVLPEVDNLLDDLVPGFGPLGEVEHVLRNLFPEKRVFVLEQPSAMDSSGYCRDGEMLPRTRGYHGHA